MLILNFNLGLDPLQTNYNSNIGPAAPLNRPGQLQSTLCGLREYVTCVPQFDLQVQCKFLGKGRNTLVLFWDWNNKNIYCCPQDTEQPQNQYEPSKHNIYEKTIQFILDIFRHQFYFRVFVLTFLCTIVKSKHKNVQAGVTLSM